MATPGGKEKRKEKHGAWIEREKSAIMGQNACIEKPGIYS